MASELLKNRALIQKLKEPEIPKVNFGLDEVDVEFVLPEPKPQELLDIQEDVRIQRQQDTMDKARPFLMDESLDFIRRQSFANGTFFLPELAELPNFPFSEATIRKRISKGDAKFDEKYIKGLEDAGFEILPKRSPRSPVTLKTENLDESLKKLNEFALSLDKPPERLYKPYRDEVKKVFEKLSKSKKPFSQADIIRGVSENLKDNPLTEQIRRESFIKIINKTLTDTEKKKLSSGKILSAIEKSKPKAALFENLLGGIGDVKQLAKNTDLTEKEVEKRVTNLVRKIYETRKKISLGKEATDLTLRDYSLDDYKKVLNTIKASSALSSNYRRGMSDLIYNAYGDPESKTYNKKYYDRATKRLNSYFNIKKALQEKFPNLKLQLDHPLSEKAIRDLGNVDPDKFLRVSPIPAEINLGLKKSFDIRYKNILDGLRSNLSESDRKKLIKQKASLEVLAKDIGLPFGKISKDDKITKFGTSEFLKKDFAKEIKEGLNLKNKIIENVKKIPDIENRFKEVFGESRSKASDLLNKLKKSDDVEDVIKFLNPLLRKFPGLRAEILPEEDIVRYASANNILSDAVFVDEPSESTANTIAKGTGFLTGAAAATPKGKRFGKKAAEQILKFGTSSVLPMVGAPLTAALASLEQQKGKPPLEAFADVFGLGPVVREKRIADVMGKEAQKEYATQKYGLGPLGTLRDPKGELPVDPDLENRRAFAEALLELEDEERAEAFKKLIEEQGIYGPEIDRTGAVGGGIMRLGFADGPKDPSKRKFMKLMGIMSLLPFGIGKGFKMAEKAAPVVSEGVKLGMDKLLLLVDKIKKFGTDVSSKFGTKEREKVITYEGKDGSQYDLYEDLTTGDIRVERNKTGVGSSGDKTYDTIEDKSTFEIRKGEEVVKDEGLETQKVIKADDEYEEGKAVFDQDGTVADFDEVDDSTIKAIEDEIN